MYYEELFRIMLSYTYNNNNNSDVTNCFIFKKGGVGSIQ